jgi:hypothetical protein
MTLDGFARCSLGGGARLDDRHLIVAKPLRGAHRSPKFLGADAPVHACHMVGTGPVSRVTPVQTAMRNCTRDEGRSFEVGNQVLISSHRKLLSLKATVVNVAEKSGHDPVRHD